MEEERRQPQREDKKIDLIVLLHGYLKGLRKLWWLVLLLGIVFAGVYCLRSIRNYTPMYKSTASFTVSVNNGSSTLYYYDQSMAEQMADTFPYLLESELLTDLIKTELGVSSINGSISASCLENTNLFTLMVTSTSAEDAYAILNAVINNYPTVSRYVVGETELVMLEEPALAVSPYNSRNIKHSLMKGFVLGIAAGLIIVLIYAAARRTIKREDDVRNILSVSCLGIIPDVSKKKGRNKTSRASVKHLSILDQNTDEAFRESLRAIALREDKTLSKENSKVLMVTAAAPGEGASTAAINLAYALAELDRRIIYIDADLRSGHENIKEFGLEDVITGKCRLKDAAVKVKNSSVLYFACKKPMTDKEIQANSDRIKKFYSTVKKSADYIIIDSPPVSRMGDAAFAAENSDCVVFAAKQDYLPAGKISDAIDEVCGFGVRFDGLIITFMKTGVSGYGYGRYSRYYGRYAYRKYGYSRYGGYGGYSQGGYYGYGPEKKAGEDS